MAHGSTQKHWLLLLHARKSGHKDQIRYHPCPEEVIMYIRWFPKVSSKFMTPFLLVNSSFAFSFFTSFLTGKEISWKLAVYWGEVARLWSQTLSPLRNTPQWRWCQSSLQQLLQDREQITTGPRARAVTGTPKIKAVFIIFLLKIRQGVENTKKKKKSFYSLSDYALYWRVSWVRNKNQV